MNRDVKKTVYRILENDEYARENDNYLIVKVAQILDPELAGSKFVELINSRLSMASITRARRQFFADYPELKPSEITQIREIEEIQYREEYGNHIPRLD